MLSYLPQKESFFGSVFSSLDKTKNLSHSGRGFLLCYLIYPKKNPFSGPFFLFWIKQKTSPIRVEGFCYVVEKTERQRFELWVPFGTTVFKTAAFNRSATSPNLFHKFGEVSPNCLAIWRTLLYLKNKKISAIKGNTFIPYFFCDVESQI